MNRSFVQPYFINEVISGTDQFYLVIVKRLFNLNISVVADTLQVYTDTGMTS